MALAPLLAVVASAARAPRPFPTAASYTAHLVTTNASKLCAECTFDGRHHFDADPAKSYGHVAWLYGPTAAPLRRVNFMDVFLGAREEMILVQDLGHGAAQCVKVSPYPAPVFNRSWAAGAEYAGVVWFQRRLCHSWTGVYPFFIQGEVRASTYYEDVFSGRPAGFVNAVETFWYDAADFEVGPVAQEWFLATLELNCSSAAARPVRGVA